MSKMIPYLLQDIIQFVAAWMRERNTKILIHLFTRLWQANRWILLRINAHVTSGQES